MDCPTFKEYGLDSISPIGSGTFGEVFLVSNNKKETFAVKVIKDQNMVSPIEIAIQSSIDNPYIMKINLLYSNNSIQIAMPLAPIGILEIIKPEYTFDDRISISRKILEGITCLHSNGITHNDLKPENILLRLVERNKRSILEPYIIDFGLSRIMKSMISGKVMTANDGTVHYLPPEILINDQSKTRIYNDKIDIWAYGLILYHIFTGEEFYTSNIFTAQSVYGFIQARTNGGSLSKFLWGELNKKRGISIQDGDIEQIYYLISLCLEIDPKKRPHAYQLLSNSVFARISSPIEKCYFNSVTNRKPVNLIRAESMAKLIVKLCSFNPSLQNTPIGMLYHAVDISYMYLFNSDISQNDELVFVLSCIGISVRFHGYGLGLNEIKQILNFIGSNIDPMSIEKMMIHIIKTLSGKIWRKYLYESVKTREDLVQSFSILYKPDEYCNYKANPVNPITYIEPINLRDMKIYQFLENKR